MHAIHGNGAAILKTVIAAAAILFGQDIVNAAEIERTTSPAMEQAQALAYIQDIATTRNAGTGVLLTDIGVNAAPSSADENQGGYIPAKARIFGNIHVDTAVTLQSETNPTVLLIFKSGCVQRDLARQRFQFKEVVASPGPEDLHPVVGYGFYLGGSALSLYFEAKGNNCLTGARIEDAAALSEVFRKRDEQTLRLEESKAIKRRQGRATGH